MTSYLIFSLSQRVTKLLVPRVRLFFFYLVIRVATSSTPSSSAAKNPPSKFSGLIDACTGARGSLCSFFWWWAQIAFCSGGGFPTVLCFPVSTKMLLPGISWWRQPAKHPRPDSPSSFFSPSVGRCQNKSFFFSRAKTGMAVYELWP